MKKEKNIFEEPIRKVIKLEDNPFPVGIIMKGDDFSFEIEISLAMAGKIVEYIAAERTRIAKLT